MAVLVVVVPVLGVPVPVMVVVDVVAVLDGLVTAVGPVLVLVPGVAPVGDVISGGHDRLLSAFHANAAPTAGRDWVVRKPGGRSGHHTIQ